MAIQIGGGGGGGGAPVDAQYVVTAADGTLSAEIVVPQLGYYDPDTPPAAAGTYDDEFDDDSIAVAWTLTGGFDANFDLMDWVGGAHGSESIMHGMLMLQACAATKAFTPNIAQAFTVAVKLHLGYFLGTNSSYASVKVVGQSAAHYFEIQVGRTTGSQQARTLFNNGGGAAQGALVTWGGESDVYLLLTHDGGEKFGAWIGSDGIGWQTIQLDQAVTNMNSFTSLVLEQQAFSISAFEFVRYFTTEAQYKIGKDV